MKRQTMWNWCVGLFSLAIVAGMIAPMAMARTDDGAHVEKLADSLCAKPSIEQSRAWMQRMSKQEVELRSSITATPLMRMQAQINALTATKAFEDLVMNCVIWRVGRIGV